jgi:hypothetical protein
VPLGRLALGVLAQVPFRPTRRRPVAIDDVQDAHG